MIVVYSKDNCPQCKQAESLLRLKNKEFKVLKLDEDYTREDIFKIFDDLKLPQPRSFPIIFNNNVAVGDLTALKVAIVERSI